MTFSAGALLSEIGAEAETIRLAGVYALERIMRDSEKDHATIVQLLAAFIRRGSPMPKRVEEKSDPVVPDDVKAALFRARTCTTRT
ncbi:hypothetical protein ACFY5F_50800 [Streptomyces sp. NPDC013161]|uniref:hypothetical protein n=1 Tax=Streptomyces sp. NPDC013161 TaxID=3364862 RepID=UPI003676E4E4